jgi:hypothetical protein
MTCAPVPHPCSPNSPIPQVRAIHQTLQVGGCGLLLLGCGFIVAYKLRNRLPLLPHTIHGWLGLLLLLLLCFQAFSGFEKASAAQVNIYIYIYICLLIYFYYPNTVF